MTKLKATVEGIEDVRAILERIAPKHARNLLRATTLGAAAHVGKIARRGAPKGETGRLRKAIKWRRRKSPPTQPIAEVYVNRGESRSDPTGAWYWHFVEYGTAGFMGHPGVSERPYIRPAKVQFQKDKGRIVTEQFVKKLNSKLKREQKARRK